MMEILGPRIAAAEELLRGAVRLELTSWLSRAVEERLRARPHFLARMPQIALVQLRLDLERTVEALAARVELQLTDLRVFFGASPRTAAVENQAVAQLFAGAVDEARRLLTEWVFPGDDRPDRADDTGVDLEAEYRLAFTPSANLLWAFSNARGVDSARNQLADAGAGPIPVSFEIRRHCPEALPLDPT